MHVSVTRLREELSELLNEVMYTKERHIVVRHDREIAAIVSMDDLQLLEQIDRMLTRGELMHLLGQAENETPP